MKVIFPLMAQGTTTDRERDVFERLMGDFFQKHTKRKLTLDEVVAVLSEIAFPGKPVDPANILARRRRRRPKP
jgi:hypothetical protein